VNDFNFPFNTLISGRDHGNLAFGLDEKDVVNVLTVILKNKKKNLEKIRIIIGLGD